MKIQLPIVYLSAGLFLVASLIYLAGGRTARLYWFENVQDRRICFRDEKNGIYVFANPFFRNSMKLYSLAYFDGSRYRGMELICLQHPPFGFQQGADFSVKTEAGAKTVTFEGVDIVRIEEGRINVMANSRIPWRR